VLGPVALRRLASQQEILATLAGPEWEGRIRRLRVIASDLNPAPAFLAVGFEVFAAEGPLRNNPPAISDVIEKAVIDHRLARTFLRVLYAAGPDLFSSLADIRGATLFARHGMKPAWTEGMKVLRKEFKRSNTWRVAREVLAAVLEGRTVPPCARIGRWLHVDHMTVSRQLEVVLARPDVACLRGAVVTHERGRPAKGNGEDDS
jgi:hypothetical protein